VLTDQVVGFVDEREVDVTGCTKTVKSGAFCKEYEGGNIVRLKSKTFKSDNNVLNLIT
jgi:hypothetical protein